MNLFEKIQQVRVRLQEEPIKMTGKNAYAGYDYFELDDFVKQLNKLMVEYKMTAIPSFTEDVAILTAINVEKPEETFVISSPMGKAELKGCHEVQNIGAVETYQRRYLYQAMFDITESDVLNKTHGKPTTTQQGSVKAPTKAETTKVDNSIKESQKAEELPFNDVKKISNTDVIKDALKGTGWSLEIAERCSMKNYAKGIEELNAQQLKNLIFKIEEAKNGKA